MTTRGPGAPGTPGGTEPAPEGVSRGLALLVAGGLFMEIVDGTVIAPAVPPRNFWKVVTSLSGPLWSG